MIGTLAIAVAVAAALGAVLLYNGLVRARLRVREGWSAMDVQLQRRASLIPNLVEVVRGYAAYERDTLERLTAARTSLTSAASPPDAARANADLNGALTSLLAVAEAYPALKANERYAQLQRDLSQAEDLIARARNYYNGAVEAYNIRVQSVPGVLVAGPLGFRRAEFFSADAGAAAAPVVSRA
jgi:LemA protein